MTITARNVSLYFILPIVLSVAGGSAVAADSKATPQGSTPSAVAISTTQDPSILGQSVTITATVTPSASASGLVTFYDGQTPLGTKSLSGGAASLSTVLLPSGSRSLHAYYAGNFTLAPSTSPAFTQVVTTVVEARFANPVNYNAGIQPRIIVAGDFNGDGKADLAVSNQGSSFVNVFLGNGDGTFRIAPIANTGLSPFGIAVGDFNQDGKQDLVVANDNFDGAVSVLLGNGDGTFQQPISYATGKFSTSVAVGDFNGDGKPDLVVTNIGSNTMSILLGKGDGTFQNSVAYAASNQPNFAAVADFNGDGIADILLASVSGQTLDVYLGNGDGTFPLASGWMAGINPSSVTVGDLNGDGKVDIVASNFGSSDVSVLLGNGDGTFQNSVDYPAGSSPGNVAIVDVNGDGKPDLAVPNYGSNNTVSVLLGNGDGTFHGLTSFPTGTNPIYIVAGDFNGDGKVDLATANYDGGNVSVLLGQGTPLASSVVLSSSPNPANLSQLVTFTATVSPSTATGTVTFKDGSTTLGSATLSNSVATFSTMTLAAGFHSVTAIFAGDLTLAGSTSNTVNENVGTSAPSTTTLLSSPNPASPGQGVTMVAVVSPVTSNSIATPTGTVTFVDGSSALATVVLNSGAAILTVSTLTVGPHSLTATYNGDSNYGSSSSTPITQQVVTPICGYSVSPSAASVIAAPSTGSFTVNTPAGCPFTATVASNSTGLVTITGVSGNTVNYSLPSNSTSAVRSASILITGQNFTQNFNIVQGGLSTNCTYQLAQLGQSFTSGGGSGSIGIITPVGCPWSLNSSSVPTWATVAPPFSGSGKATLSYTVANSFSAITRVANLTFAGTVQTQVALSYGVTETGTATTASCTVSGTSPVTQVALEGRTEVLGSLTLNCTGLTGSITTDILLNLNTPVTNQVNGSTNLSDATLTNGSTVQGAQVIGYSTLRWPGVVLNPTGGSASLTIGNVRADASTLAPTGGPAPQATFPIIGQVSLNSAGTVPLPNPTITLANAVTTLLVQTGSVVPANGTQATLELTYQETLAAPTAFSSSTGRATRLRAVVSSVPAGVQVWAPVSASAGTATAQLYTADCSGAGGSPAAGTSIAGGSYARLTVTGGIATATWVVTSALSSVDTLAFPLLFVNPGGINLSGVQVEGSLAPVSPAGSACSSDVAAAAIPRYRDFTVPITQTFLRLTTSGTFSGSSLGLGFIDTVMNEGSTAVTNATATGIVQTGSNTISCAATGGVGGTCVGYGSASAPQLKPGQYMCSWTSLPPGPASCSGSGIEDATALSQPATLVVAGVTADGAAADLAATQSQALITQNFGPNVQIESPVSGSVTGTVNVSGWTVDAAVAVSSVQVQVDGVTKGTVTTFTSRPDVCNVYSNYFGCMNAAGPNVGFSVPLDTTTLSSGSHALTVLATATDGTSMLSSPPIAITTGSTSLRSIAVTPTNSSIAAGAKQQFTATGTYSDNSTQNITSSVVWASATPSVATIATTGLATAVNGGSTTITATSGSVSGSTLLTVTANGVVLPTVAIDQPAPGANVSAVFTVSGWALDNTTAVGTAISSVQVKVDGVVLGTATYGTARPDVCAAYPGRPGCPNVGYTFSLNTATVTAGSHLLTVCATDSDSVPDTGCNSITINTAVPASLPSVVIDTPANNATLSGTVAVTGWAIDNTTALGTAISTVKVKVDGAIVGTASYGTSRPDVCSAFPGRAGCPNVGYSFQLNTTGLSSGTHTLSVSATDSDPTPDTGNSPNLTFTIAGSSGPPPSVVIDSPLPNTSVSGIVTVSGWAIDNTTASGTAISIVQVNVDGAFVGTATYGLARPDVCAAFPARPGCPNVGYTFALNTAGLSTGSHTVTVLATDSDGTPDIGSKSVTIIVMGSSTPPLVYIDNPTSGMVVSGTVNVSGWAIDNPASAGGTPIAIVQMKVDGTVVGNATYGTPRTDVCTAFPNRPSCPNVGWTFSLDTSSLTSGAHTLTAVATDTDGSPDSGTWAVTIMVAPQPVVAIDSPGAGSAVSGTVTVNGWAIDFAGGNAIASVVVKVDGNFVGNATYGTARPDVCAAFPNRVGCPNVGYTFSLNTATLSPGTHTLTVQAADSSSTPSIGSKTINFTTSGSGVTPPLVHIDSPSPGSTVSGTVTVSGWAIDNGSAVGTAIGSVQVMVDGSAVGSATYGVARPDVCAAYPGRLGCSNVGFTFSLNTSTLAAGSHTITVTAADTDGTPDSGSTSVTVTK